LLWATGEGIWICFGSKRRLCSNSRIYLVLFPSLGKRRWYLWI